MTELHARLLNVHRIGSHCTTSAIRNLLHFAGHDISEESCLGLGCGLGFSYYKLPDMPLYSFNGRTRNLEQTLCRVLGIDFQMFHSLGHDETIVALEELVSEGSPLMLNMDWNHVPYLTEKFRGDIQDKILLAEHSNILLGIKDGVAQCIEYYDRNIHQIPVDTLVQAMSSRIEEKALWGVFYRVKAPARLLDRDWAMCLAVYGNSHDMRFGFGSNFGLDGMKRFFDEFMKWPSVMELDEIVRNCTMAYTSFEKWGNGGGNFRLMYSRFLREVADCFADPEMREWSFGYAQLSRLWKQLSIRLQNFGKSFSMEQTPSPVDLSVRMESEFHGLMHEILAQEIQLNHSLYDWSVARLS